MKTRNARIIIDENKRSASEQKRRTANYLHSFKFQIFLYEARRESEQLFEKRRKKRANSKLNIENIVFFFCSRGSIGSRWRFGAAHVSCVCSLLAWPKTTVDGRSCSERLLLKTKYLCLVNCRCNDAMLERKSPLWLARANFSQFINDPMPATARHVASFSRSVSQREPD